MNVEVLIYIRKLREFLKKNTNVSYFFSNKKNYDEHIDLFIDIISRFANRNFEETGMAQLTSEQFEMAKDEMDILINNSTPVYLNHIPIIYVDERGYFKIKKQ